MKEQLILKIGKYRLNLSTLVFLLGITGILLIGLSSWLPEGGRKEDPGVREADAKAYADGLEERLTAILQEIDGVGRARVMVTLENGYQKVYARSEKTNNDLLEDVRAAHPDAILYVQSILPINEQKFLANYGYSMTNAEIDECNAALLKMCGEIQVYYVDVAEAIKDETGGLPADFTTDGLHFKGEYYNKWIDYLKEHTVPAS